MDIWELKVFLAVASERSISRAAAKLYRTQPAISQAIRKLELVLGEQLFDRRTGALTDAGELLQERATKVVQLADEAELAVKQLRQPAPKRVTIGVNEASVHILLPIIAKCRQRYPELEFDVRRAPSHRVGADVLAGTLEFGLLVSQEVSPGLQAVIVGYDQVDAILHPSHPLAKRERISLEDLREPTIVVHSEVTPARDRLLRLFSEHHVPITTISLPTLDAIKEAVEMQLGITLLPRWAAFRELEEGRLVAVPLKEVSERRAMRLVYHRDRVMPDTAKWFLEVALELQDLAPSWSRQTRPSEARPS